MKYFIILILTINYSFAGESICNVSNPLFSGDTLSLGSINGTNPCATFTQCSIDGEFVEITLPLELELTTTESTTCKLELTNEYFFRDQTELTKSVSLTNSVNTTKSIDLIIKFRVKGFFSVDSLNKVIKLSIEK
jgi:hypothetical protein